MDLTSLRLSRQPRRLLMLRRKCCGAGRIPARFAQSLILRRRRNLQRDRSQGDTRNHPMSSSSVFCWRRRRSDRSPRRSGTAVAHLLCWYSLAKHTDTAKNEPLRLEARIRGKLLRLASVSAARHCKPTPSPTPHFACGRGAMWKARRIIHAISTGGQNGQELQESSPRFGGLLRRLRRKVWAYSLLLLAYGALLQEVRRPVQSAQGGRP